MKHVFLIIWIVMFPPRVFALELTGEQCRRLLKGRFIELNLKYDDNHEIKVTKNNNQNLVNFEYSENFIVKNTEVFKKIPIIKRETITSKNIYREIEPTIYIENLNLEQGESIDFELKEEIGRAHV